MIFGKHCAFIVFVSMFVSGCASQFKAHQELIYGDYDKIVNRIETKDQLTEIDRYYLCAAYAGKRDYRNIFKCVDEMLEAAEAGELRGGSPYSMEPARDQLLLELHVFKTQALIDLGHLQEALEQINKSLLPKTYAGSANYNYKFYGWRGLAHALLRNREEALKYAKLTQKEIDGLNVKDKRSLTATIYLSLGEFEEALAEIDKGDNNLLLLLTAPIYSPMLAAVGMEMEALGNIVTMSAPAEVIAKGYMRALLLFEAGKIEQSRKVLAGIVDLSQLNALGSTNWKVYHLRSRISKREGRRDEAIEDLKKSIDFIESLRTRIDQDTSRIGFVGDKERVYEDLVVELVDAGRFKEAFEYVERAKARALVDMLASKKQFASSQQTSQQLSVLMKRLDEAEQEAQRGVYVTPENDKRQTADTRGLVIRTRDTIDKVAPELSNLISVRPPDVKTIQSLLKPDDTLVEYYGSGGNLFAFVVTDAAIQAVKLDGNGLNRPIESFRKAIADAKSDAWRRHALALHKRLVAPIADMVKTSDLLVVPHGSLHYLPFSALHSGNSFLVDNHAIRTLPAASVLGYLKAGDSRATSELLVFGNPDLGRPDMDLPGAETEARAILGLRPNTKVILRKNASETMFKKVGGQFRNLHFASHGKFYADRPLESGLLLTADNDNDGMLTVGELYETRLDADTVILSACETGVGKVANGDDVLGLTRGFLYAGARSIIASLWPVSDEATVLLMVNLYQNFAKMQNMATALRMAQLETRSAFPHPFYWAAFQMTGRKN